MKRIIVKMEDVKEKLLIPHDFFDALHFAIMVIERTYGKMYGDSLNEQNLFERHEAMLKSIPIKFVIETITERRK